MDLTKLLMSDWRVEMVNDDMHEFFVEFPGPDDSPYKGGVWKVRVELPEAYPYCSPSIGFVNRIFHPNVDESAGSVCLDVINQTWSPMFDLFNVFETFLPQLLLYPNPSDPLNGEAAALLMQDTDKYNKKVREYVSKYAKPEDAGVKSCTEGASEGGRECRERGRDGEVAWMEPGTETERNRAERTMSYCEEEDQDKPFNESMQIDAVPNDALGIGDDEEEEEEYQSSEEEDL